MKNYKTRLHHLKIAEAFQALNKADLSSQAVKNRSVGRNNMNTESNPLQGKTLESILNELVANYGWLELGLTIKIKCFQTDPSIKSSLIFLRKTPWARKKVESLYLDMVGK
jgi:uncharacterized protein (DUF2132 family)